MISRAKTNVSTELDGETVILDISSGIYSGLDPIGTEIWNILQQPMSFALLREQIIKNYDVSKEQCTQDLMVFLQKLLDNNLIAVDE